jgi:uncharacterized protein (DUF2235 family)
MAKRLAVCCDGTWNHRDQPNPTNVTKVHAALASDDHGIQQLRHYEPGVGSSWWERLRGGAFGMGLSRGVTNAYRWICQNYEPGDELFLFGFSRGAYMARSTAGLLRNCGVLRGPSESLIAQAYAIYRSDEHPDGPTATRFRDQHSHPLAPIQFVGVWDTVGSLGIPGGNPLATWINRRWQFHDTALSSYVENAFQALAIDEVREPYEPTLWLTAAHAPESQRVEQVWFCGAHSDVGGGFAETELSDLALLWLVERAEDCGLAFDAERLALETDAAPVGMPMRLRPDPHGAMHNKPSGLFRLVPRRTRPIGATSRETEAVARSAVMRHDDDTGYRPSNLLPALRGNIRQVPLPRRFTINEPA